MEKEKVLKALNSLLKDYKHFWWQRESNGYEENYLEELNEDENNEYYDDPFANPEYDKKIQEILQKSEELTIEDLPEISCYYSMYLDNNNNLKVLLNYYLNDYFLHHNSCDHHQIEAEEEHEINEDCIKILSQFKNIKMTDYYVILLLIDEEPDATLAKIISELNNFDLPKKVHIQCLRMNSDNGIYKTVRSQLGEKYLEKIITKINLDNF